MDIAALPKICLHDHLDGGLRPRTVFELAAETGVELPVADAKELGRWFAETAASHVSLDYLSMFDVTTSVMQTRDALVRVAREFVQDMTADGVVYGEVRWAPELHVRRGLSLDQAVEAVAEGIDAGIEDARLAGRDIRIGQLLCAMRTADRALEIAELTVRHRGNGVVGFDYAGPEAGFLPARHRAAFDYLADNLVPVTVHAGEAAGVESIRSAVVDGRALRIAHGVRIAEDIRVENGVATLGPLAAWVRDRQIALDLCPSSNVHVGAVSPWGDDVSAHPFDLLYRLGFLVTISPDSRLMSNTTLVKELEILSETFGYGPDDLLEFQLNAAAVSFLPYDEREALADLIVEGFAAAPSD